MRHIEKSKKEPPELLAYRKSAGEQAYWDGLPNKAAVRSRLLKDQGALCCYCMQRIEVSSMKTEHYLCRDRHPTEQLRWENLLAACRGGEGEPVETCDTSKKSKDITIDPRKRHDMETLRYLTDGTIKSRENRFEADINAVLNLNTTRLKQFRKEALDGFLSALRKRLGSKGNWSVRELQGAREKIRLKEPLPAFAGMLEWWLERKMPHHPI